MDNKIAVVTGASKGIGKAISRRLISEGYFTILVDIDKENGLKLESENFDKSKYYNCDISNENSVSDFFEFIKSNYGTLDVLVNNAGIIKDNMIWNMPTEDFDKVVEINLKGCWLMSKQAGIIMKEQNSGRIVNITSRAWLGNRGQSNYAASKAGVVSLTRVLALELGKYNVLVNAIAPGLIDTPLTQKLPEHVIENLINLQPTKTMGSPENIAQTVSFLSNPQTEFITGQVIYVDGGKNVGSNMV
ncbi:MAG: beta-ketoacyl-ACP reductase [Parcubacteria group bacterium]|jgi:NAD(P)-dependent dehydrogenase (short-subunit alcohol dehydrogenase family)|nr:beta-ketoacyl-ACP reductase [Parcubacteria group bacterium]HJN63718.1 SDR family NAD(P)-dependent oxidoreductase [Flavobacteriales bacterium]|tara:strand:+ start:19549 stop:20286 length:738 start_codon:yes stop_codon:yes gene_type:complete